MNQAIVSVNPVGVPSGATKVEKIVPEIRIKDRSHRILNSSLRLILGVGGGIRHARRLWTFRLIIGSIMMCLGLMFTHSALVPTAEAGAHGLAMVMIAAGAMIACGFFTRPVSLAVIAVMLLATFHSGVDTMLSFVLIICSALSLISFILGSGRFSLDTLIFNALTPLRDAFAPLPSGCSAFRHTHTQLAH